MTQDDIDQAQVVDLVTGITRDQPNFELTMPALLLLAQLEYEWRSSPSKPTEAEVHAAFARQPKAQRAAGEARAKRAIMHAISAGKLSVVNTGRIGLRDCREAASLTLFSHSIPTSVDADRDLVIDILRRVGCNHVLSPAQLIAAFTFEVAGAGPRASNAAQDRVINASSEAVRRWVDRARKAITAAVGTGQVYQRPDNCIGLHRRFALALVTPPPKAPAP